jgi:hypothetical protein
MRAKEMIGELEQKLRDHRRVRPPQFTALAVIFPDDVSKRPKVDD